MSNTNKRQSQLGKRSVESCSCVPDITNIINEGCAHGSREIVLFLNSWQIGHGCTQTTGCWTELDLALILS